MFVGVLRIVLRLPASRSLKDRRRVIKSYKDRLRARLPVVVAELGNADSHQLARLGLCTVSGEHHLAEEALNKARNMANTLSDAIVVDAASEVIPFGEGGASVRGGLDSLEPLKGVDTTLLDEKFGRDE
jgi:uncharacterized protein YlxP (DUF503 family)